MPAKTYLCTNVAGGCSRAFKKELISLEAGQEPDCPVKNCRENLKPAQGIKEPPPKDSETNWLLIGGLVAGLVVAGVAGFFAWREFGQPPPDRINTELTQFYADLPAAPGAKP